MQSKKLRLVFVILTITSVISLGLALEGEDGKLYRLKLTNPQAVALDKLVATDHLDPWTNINTQGNTDIFVPTKQEAKFLKFLKDNGLSGSNVEIVNMNASEEYEIRARIPKLKKKLGVLTWDDYYNFTEIEAWMNELPKRYPNLVKLESIGKTYEGRPIHLLTITAGTGKKPGIFINSLFHAREWITGAVVTYFVNELTEKSNYNMQMLGNYRFYIVPVVNPDGYEYSWAKKRMWRKNMNPNGGGENCAGVDLERNFDIQYGGVGSTDDKCAETYRGESVCSELECQALRDFILAHPDITDYYSFHSYAQIWMTPWSYKREHAFNHDETMAIMKAAMAAQEAVHGTKYRYGASGDVYQPIAGTIEDWAMKVAKINYSYCIELRDQGTYGFKIPKDQILPSGEETWAAMRVAVQKIKSYKSSGRSTRGINVDNNAHVIRQNNLQTPFHFIVIVLIINFLNITN